jgi:two-component system response regulator PilR (NtrC family)
MILQVKLLRVIQEKAFRRVGGSEDIRVDVRIIAATNQNLEKKTKDGSFREDLYYRLNVIPIYIPPLRKRKEDIPVLTEHFIDKYSKEFGKDIKRISSYAMELLTKYRFPGNVRELENIIEKSVALGTSNIILPENLILSENNKRDLHKILDIELPDEGISLNEEMTRIESHFIKKALEKAEGSKTRAAELLRVSFDSLRYRIEKLDIR